MRLLIFASGSGTNAENIIKYFKQDNKVNIAAVLTNNKHAGVLARAENLGVATRIFDKEEFKSSQDFVNYLKNSGDLIVLAGFLWKIPTSLLAAFPNKIINIHPALLPKYGGKGMYGMHVHRAVVAHREKESGITIHYVNENYDEGAIIFQKSIAIDPQDTPEQVAAKIHQLEQAYFPKVIDELVIPKIE